MAVMLNEGACRPRMKLSPDVPVSDSFRETFDAWLLEFFGTEPVVSLPMSVRRPAPLPDGRFVGMKTLLESIDETFSKLARLKRSKHETAKLLRKNGPMIVPYDQNALCEENYLEGFATYGLPSMLFVDTPWSRYFQDQKKDGFEHLSYAVKFDKLPVVLKRRGFSYYKFGCYWPKQRGDRTPEFSIQAYVGVHEITGEVIAIPVLQTLCKDLKANSVTSHKAKTIPNRAWRYLALTDDFSLCQEEQRRHIVSHFCAIYSFSMWREFDVNIVVTKAGAKATFLVPHHRWKDFFKDRLDVLASDGKRARIFHAVTAHTRSNGSNVRTYYKGSRHFCWRGYEVSIVIPGKHGAPQASFGVSATVMPEETAIPSGFVPILDVSLGQHFGHHA